MKTLLVTEHATGEKHICRIASGQTATQLIETFQRNLKKLGCPTGCTWRVHKGGIVSSLIASAERG